MVRIHKEGHKFLFVLFVIGFAINLVIFLLDLSIWVKGFVLLLTVFELFFFLQFFRSPVIKKNIGDKKIISPANGKVVHIGEVFEDEYFKEKKRKNWQNHRNNTKKIHHKSGTETEQKKKQPKLKQKTENFWNGTEQIKLRE